jgi:hypothetical protein
MKIKNNFSTMRLMKYALLLFLVLNISCNKKEIDATNNSQISSNIIQGQWKISYFLISRSDKTSDFNGYIFTFNTNNTVTAMQGGSGSANGTWSIVQNTNSGGERLVLNFGNQFYFQQLNGEWFANRNDYNRISLENLVGSSGNTDYLTFDKL